LVTPYTQSDNIRTFNAAVHSDELIWHRDKQDREVTVLSGKDWQLQLDNALPVILEENKTYHIPKYVYHRVLKGKEDLVIEINEKV